MAKLILYPNGKTGSVSDKVAEILAKRPGHKLVAEPKPEPVQTPKASK